MGCHALFQGIFPTQGSNPHLLSLLHCRWILYPLSHLGILTNSPVLLPLVPGALMGTLGLDFPSVCTHLPGAVGRRGRQGSGSAVSDFLPEARRLAHRVKQVTFSLSLFSLTYAK